MQGGSNSISSVNSEVYDFPREVEITFDTSILTPEIENLIKEEKVSSMLFLKNQNILPLMIFHIILTDHYINIS